MPAQVDRLLSEVHGAMLTFARNVQLVERGAWDESDPAKLRQQFGMLWSGLVMVSADLCQAIELLRPAPRRRPPRRRPRGRP